MASEAQRKANKKYKEKVNRITVDFSPTEAELWERVQSQPKKQTYIKNLIRADIEHGVYLILKDSMDDTATIKGYICGTLEDADRYCDELNKGNKYEYEDYYWRLLEKLNK